MVYDALPSNLLAEKSIIDFKNDALPLPGDYNAYCQVWSCSDVTVYRVNFEIHPI